MLKRIEKTRHKSRQAFTLTELIVVLVVLAVLAAIIVPALTGYISRAKKDKYYEDAHYALTAAQAVIAECYGKGYVSKVGTHGTGGGGGSAGDRRWDIGAGTNATDEEKAYGEKVLNLFDRTRDDEPYLLIFGCGRPGMGLDETELFKVYYVAYVANENAPAIFYINGEWRYKYPTDNPEKIYKTDAKDAEGKNIKVNFLKLGKNRNQAVDIPLQFYVVSNKTEIADNFWTDKSKPGSLINHCEPYFKG